MVAVVALVLVVAAIVALCADDGILAHRYQPRRRGPKAPKTYDWMVTVFLVALSIGLFFFTYGVGAHLLGLAAGWLAWKFHTMDQPRPLSPTEAAFQDWLNNPEPPPED